MVRYMPENPDVEIVVHRDPIASVYNGRTLSNTHQKTWTITNREIREAPVSEAYIVSRYLATSNGRDDIIKGLRVSAKTYKGPEPVARNRFQVIDDA
jgi:hypothetical protein